MHPCTHCIQACARMQNHATPPCCKVHANNFETVMINMCREHSLTWSSVRSMMTLGFPASAVAHDCAHRLADTAATAAAMLLHPHVVDGAILSSTGHSSQVSQSFDRLVKVKRTGDIASHTHTLTHSHTHTHHHSGEHCVESRFRGDMRWILLFYRKGRTRIMLTRLVLQGGERA
jgi:hypothetical protein